MSADLIDREATARAILQIDCTDLADPAHLLEAVAAAIRNDRVVPGCAGDSTLRAERDEADRRAGAAERRNAQLLDEASRRADWLRRAKEAAGYSDATSFDVVWAAALAALLELRAQPPAWDGLAVMDHGMRTTPGYAAKELRGRGLVGLIHNLERLQEWLDAYVAHARAANRPEAPRGGSER